MKYTLITGATSGIGKAMAYKFASQNKNLILIGRSDLRLERLKKDLICESHIDVVTITCDLSKQELLENAYKKTKLYDIELWINNAGVGDYSLAWETNVSKAVDMAQINMNALMTFSLLYIQDYVNQEVILLNVSSGGGYFVFNKAVTYCATKFFVSAFSEGIAQNLRLQNKKMKVKILAPGGTNTNFVKHAEKEATYSSESIFDVDSFMEPEELVENLDILLESDKIIGMINGDNIFELRDPIFQFGG
jgi:short-subunit dehydrogenase